MNKTMIPQETTKHLHALHGQLGAFQLRLINDRDKTRPVLTFRSTLDRLPEVWPEIDRLNREEHYGVFVVVNKMPAGSATKLV